MARRQAALEPRLAATVIQAQYRAHRTRQQLRRKQDAAQRIQARVRGWLARVRRAEAQRERQRVERFNRIMSRHGERIKAREQELHFLRTLPAAELERYEEVRGTAARRIQAAWKGHRTRGEFRRRQPELERRQMAASRIQVAFRTSSPTRASQSENLTAGKEYEGGVRKSGADSPLRASTTVIPARDANGVLVISESRRAQLTSQIEQRVQRHRSSKQVPHVDEEAIRMHKRYEALLRERNKGRNEREQSMHNRMHARRQAEISFGNLVHKHTALTQIPTTAEPYHFSLPPDRKSVV